MFVPGLVSWRSEGSGKWLGWRPLQQCCPHQNCSVGGPAETAREELGSASLVSPVV